MVTIENLHKKYGKNEVLKGLDLTINGGGIIAVLGPNGSGKTTLIKSILGMVIPQQGSISIKRTSVKNNWQYRKEIDYLPQIANFPGNLSVKELIKMIKDLRNKPANDDELIAYFKLEDFLDKKLVNLSGGTKQKVNLILTFMFDSPLVILDEPTSGLDPISLIRLKEWILKEKAKGKTILITSHIMSFVEDIAEDVIFILEGKIYFNGSVTELKTQTGQTDFEHAIATILSENHV
ncbi:MAG: ABC transporter ATP-binding protein [Flavobacteriaceae bacterium]